MKSLPYLLAVHKALNLTMNRYGILSSFFANDWQKVWKSSQKEVFESGLDKRGREKFLKNRKNICPHKIIDELEEKKIGVLFYESPDYPWQLKNIYNPPIVLFSRGRLRSSDFPSIGVVGARGVTSYGKIILEKMIPVISQSGLSIVSGFAFGVDILSHKISVDSGARTIGVLGNAIDTVYPSSHKAFAEKIIAEDSGVLLSEYFPGQKTLPEHFPARNRIIAGLCKALIVIEAGKKSGSLITAKLALENGKDIFAVPGNVFSRMSEGTNYLLSKGMAHAAVSGEYILDLLGIDKTPTLFSFEVSEDPEESHLLTLFSLHKNMLHIDDIFRLSHLERQKITALLSLLEIKGRIKSIGGNKYILHG